MDLRIPPADAGTSDIPRLPYLCATDHPRGCGDKQYLACVCLMGWGSPPRMRGQATRRFNAYKGSQDHPRGCGDKSLSYICVFQQLGSPPRMRGQG